MNIKVILLSSLLVCIYQLTSLHAEQRRDCRNALILCDTTPITDNISSPSFGSVFDFPSSPCGTISEIYPYWYKFEAQNDGNFEMGIYPQDSTHDFNFAFFDITNGCAPTDRITMACNDSTVNCGPTGISSIEMASDTCNPVGENNWVSTLNLIEGRIYAIYIEGDGGNPPPTGAAFTVRFHMNNLANPVLFQTIANVTPAGPVVLCNNDSTELIADEADAYQWYRNGTIISGATNQNYFAKVGGNYTIVVTSGLGCEDSLDVPVIVNVVTPVANVTPAGPETICDNDSIQLTSSSADSYQWYKNGTAIAGATDRNYFAKQAGDYTVKISIGGCEDSLTTPVTINTIPAPTANVTPSDSIVICNTDSVRLTSDPANTYQWYRNGNAISGATGQTYDVRQSGSYTIVVANNLGCEDSLTTPIVATTGSAQAGILPKDTQEACVGETITLTAEFPADSFYLYRDGIFVVKGTRMTYMLNTSGNYTLIAFSGACQDSLDVPVTLIFHPLPTANVTLNTNDSVCNGDSVELVSDPANSYQWFLNGSVIAGATNQNYFAKTSGSYTVAVTNTFNCSDTLNLGVEVTILPNPVASVSPAGPVSICNGDSIELTSTSADTYQWYRNGTVIAGATDQTYQAKLDGNYTLVVTTLGCSDSLTTAVSVSTIPFPIANVVPSGPVNICSNDSIELISDQADAYQWYRNGVAIVGATDSNYFANLDGDYTIIVTNGGMCSDSLTTAVEVTTIITPMANITPNGSLSICTGDSIELVSDPADTYQWYRDGTIITGATNQDYFAKTNGDYTIVVMNGGICTDSLTIPVTVIVKAFPIANVTPNGPVTICDNDSIELVSDLADAYQWYRDGTAIAGATGSNYFAKLDGDYTIVVTNGTNCSDSLSIAVEVNTIATPVANVTPSGSVNVSQGDSIELIADPAATYQWYRDGVIITGATNQNYYAKIAGDYTVVVTNGGVCSDSLATAVMVNIIACPIANVSPPGPDTICSNDSIELVADVADGYQWYRDGIAISGATDSNYFAKNTGDYTVVVTNGGVCSDSLTTPVSITANPTPIAFITPNGIINICNNDSVLLEGPSGIDVYQWYKDGDLIVTATDSFYYANAPGDYTIKVTENGCSDSLATPVTVSTTTAAVASVSPSGLVNICTGDSIELTAGPADSFQWYFNGSLITGAIDSFYVAKNAGDYTLVVRNDNGCSDSLDTPVTIVINPVPSAAIIDTNGPIIICNGQDAVELISESEVNYQWLLDGNPIAGETDSNLITRFSGNYQVIAIAGIGCSDTSDVVTIFANPSPTAQVTIIGSTTLCEGDSIIFISDSTADTYEWYRNGVQIAGANDSIYTTDTSGMYQLVLVNSFGCADTSSAINVIIAPPVTPAPDAVKDIVNICEEDTAIIAFLNNDLNYDNSSMITILKTASNGTTSFASVDSLVYIPNQNFTGSDTIFYEICNQLSPCDTTGISPCDIAFIVINTGSVNDQPIANNDSIVICEDSSININVLLNDIDHDGDFMSVMLLTQTQNGTLIFVSNDSVIYTPNTGFSGLDTFTYSIVDSSAITACNPFSTLSDTATVIINVIGNNRSPVALDTSLTTCINEAKIIDIRSLINDPDNNIFSIAVMANTTASGTIGIVSQDSIIYEPDEDFVGTDVVQLIVCDNNLTGCGTSSLCDTFELTVNVLLQGDCDTTKGTEFVEVTIPNGFSPNGDGVNDFFEIVGVENYPNTELVVFNRWGNKVYEASNYQNKWDGNNKNGNRIPDGTYYYIITLDDIQKPYNGYVELHR